MKVQFGGVTLDTDARTITRDGRALTLSPKAFDLLSLLIAERPSVITFAALRARLWPQSHVGHSSLPALIAEIRGTLRESARSGGTIRTVHRVGYAFAAAATELAPATRADQPLAWLIAGDRRVPLINRESVLGREGPGVVLFSDSTVSRRHARLVLDGETAHVEDLGSKNGTWLAGVRVEGRARLEEGAEFLLGTLRIQFTRRGGEITKTVPPAADQREGTPRNKSPRTRLTT